MKHCLFGILLLTSVSSFAMETIEFVDEFSGDTSAYISPPTLGGGVLISIKSSQNGVCRALGYERAAVGSMVSGSTYRGEMVIIGADGLVSSGEVATYNENFNIDAIVCLNKLGNPIERTHRLSNPLHSDARVPFSTKSSQNGVCKSLGYDKGAPGAMISGASYRGPMVIMAGNGSVASGEVATYNQNFEIKSLVCVFKP